MSRQLLASSEGFDVGVYRFERCLGVGNDAGFLDEIVYAQR